MATPLPDNLKRAYADMQMLALQTVHLNERLRQGIQLYHESSGAVNKMVAQHQKMLDVGAKIISQWSTSNRISGRSLLEYSKLAKGVQDLTKQYKEYAAIQKLFEFLAKTHLEKITSLVVGLSKLASSATGLAARFGGLALGYKELTDRLVTYNRTVFDGMRIGQRYGDSVEEFNSSLLKLKTTTAFSKQDFAELNLVIKQMSVGIPMTSSAVGKFAETLTNKFGWSAEKVISVAKELMSIQTKLPSLITRVNKTIDAFSRSADEGAESADALYNKLLSIGASQGDIETVMSTVSKVTPDLAKWMSFERTIETSKRDIKDVNLEIAEKMKSGLETIAKIQAGIAKSINMMGPGWMMAVGGLSMFGAGLTGILIQLSSAVKMVKLIRGAVRGTLGGPGGGVPGVNTGGAPGIPATGGANSGFAPGGNYSGFRNSSTKISHYPPGHSPQSQSKVSGGGGKGGGGFGFSGARFAGAMAVSILGSAAASGLGSYDDKMTENWMRQNQGEKSTVGGLKGKKARVGALKGAADWGAKAAPLLMIPGYGAAIVGGAALVGGAVGGVKGWMEGDKLEKQHKKEKRESQALKAEQMRSIAQEKGIQIDKGASQSEIIEKLRIENNENKQLAAMQVLYAQGLIKKNDLQTIFEGNKRNEGKIAQKIDDITLKTFGYEKERFTINMQIKRAVTGQLEELERTLEVAMKLKSVGEGMPEALKTGNIGSGLARTLAGIGVQGAQSAKQTLGRKLSASFIRAHSDDPEIQKLLTPEKSAALAKMKSNEEAQKKLIRDEEAIHIKAQTDSSGVSDETAKQQIFDKANEQIAKLKQQSVDLGKSMDDLMSSTNWETLVPPSRVMEELDKLSKSLEQAGSPDAREKILVKMSLYAEDAKKLAEASGALMDLQFSQKTQKLQQENALLEKQAELGETQLSLAEKMGMPQSYRALQSQVDLTFQQYQNLEKQKAAQQEVISGWEKEHNVKLDIESVMNRTKTVAEALDEISGQTNLSVGARNDAEQKLTKALIEQTCISNEQLQKEAKLAELTKTWREGWMDAMDEYVANAGDYVSIMGLGDKNIPEKIAAGAPDTFKYGGENRKALDDYTLQQTRYGQAARFTDVYGNMSGNTKNPSSLEKHSNATLWNIQSSEALHKANVEAVKNKAIPIEAKSPLAVAGHDAQTEALPDNGASSYKPPAADTIKHGEFFNADVKARGRQPSNIPSGKLAPDVVHPFKPQETGLNDAAASLKEAGVSLQSAAEGIKRITSPEAKPSGKPTQKLATGGLVRKYSGGGVMTRETMSDSQKEAYKSFMLSMVKRHLKGENVFSKDLQEAMSKRKVLSRGYADSVEDVKRAEWTDSHMGTDMGGANSKKAKLYEQEMKRLRNSATQDQNREMFKVFSTMTENRAKRKEAQTQASETVKQKQMDFYNRWGGNGEPIRREAIPGDRGNSSGVSTYRSFTGGRGGSGRLEGRGGSSRLEDRRTTALASGGQIEPGSFVINQAASSANSDLLNSMGAGWVTGGTAGKDSVMFDVRAAGGPTESARALLMPGEAVLPPAFASIGDAINRGMPAFESGGIVADRRAARDIATSTMSRGGGGGGGGGGGAPSGGVTLELTPEVAELLRFQGKSDYRNGSSP